MADALTGIDRPQGDTADWSAQAQTWSNQGISLADALRQVHAAVSATPAHWSGQAATAFLQGAGGLASALDQTQQAFSKAGQLMSTYASALALAQVDWDAANARGSWALSEAQASLSKLTGSGGGDTLLGLLDDPMDDPDVRAARNAAQHAVDDANDAATTVVNGLNAITSIIAPVPTPKPASHWYTPIEDFGRGLVDPLVALAKLGWDTSLINTVINPSSALAADRALLDGLGHDVTHPLDFAKGLIDYQDLKDGNYAHWGGEVVSNILVAVATDGGGAAADGATDAAKTALETGSEQAAKEAALQAAEKGLPPFLQKILAGTAWHQFIQSDLVANAAAVKELILANGKRLDAYLPDAGEIVSMKNSQLAAVQESTAIGYVKELGAKYAPGTKIADVPSVPAALRGLDLEGRPVLLVPVQTAAIPAAVLQAAKAAQVEIRDINGHVYG